MARRCGGWSRRPGPGHERHLPGSCRRCWRPCRACLGSTPAPICVECQWGYARSPSAVVRAEVAQLPGVLDVLLDVLSDDQDFSVSAVARAVRSGADDWGL